MVTDKPLPSFSQDRCHSLQTGLELRRFSQVLEMTEYSFRYGQKTEKSQISSRFGEPILWP